MTDKHKDSANSIEIRINQIFEKGIVRITRSEISVSIMISDDSPSYVNSTDYYQRTISFDELKSLDLSINLLFGSNNELKEEVKKKYLHYQKCFKKANDIQNNIIALFKFGKKIVIKNKKFIDLSEKDEANIIQMIEIFQSKWNSFNLLKDGAPDYPPFLTTENLLHFGHLIQSEQFKKTDKADTDFFLLLRKMFARQFETADFEVIKKKAFPKNFQFDDPVLCACLLFHSIYDSIKHKTLGYEEWNYKRFQYYEFLQKQNEIESFYQSIEKKVEAIESNFLYHNIHLIQVNKPIESNHIFKFIYSKLCGGRDHYFFEVVHCLETTNIEDFISDASQNKLKEFNIPYLFIINPEFLTITNQLILQETINSRMIAVPDLSKQKIMIITSSQQFLPQYHENYMTYFDDKKSEFDIDEVTILREMGFSATFHSGVPFFIELVKSSQPGCGKTQYIQKKYQNKYYKSFFISLDNQEIPREILSLSSQPRIFHLQFSDHMMEKGILFWTLFYQIFYYGYALIPSGVPLNFTNHQRDGHLKDVIIFEIPSFFNKHDDFTNYNSFPLSISNYQAEDIKTVKNNIITTKKKSITTNEALGFQEFDKNANAPYIIGIKNYDVKDLKEFICTFYAKAFPDQEIPEIHFRVVGMIKKYLNKYSTLFLQQLMRYNSSLSSLNQLSSNTVHQIFHVFFKLLSLSALYTYRILPKNFYGFTFLVIDNLFCDLPHKKFTFYTTRDNSEFEQFGTQLNNIIQLVFIHNFHDKSDLKLFPKRFFSTTTFYEEQIRIFENANPASFIAKTQITWATLYRLSTILLRSYLYQSTILGGNTGCGKTSTLMLIYEYFKIPYNDEFYQLKFDIGKTLNCHGGITYQDIQLHLQQVSQSQRPHLVLFDEMNTSPASSYIEHLFLNKINKNHRPRIVFIGALNPWQEINPISYRLSKIGMPQIIRDERQNCTLFKCSDINKPEKISKYMYHVHKPQESTKDIIINFDPIAITENEEIFYPNEEREAMHSIIHDVMKNQVNNTTDFEELSKLVDECILFVRQLMNEHAVISYRDIERLMIIYIYLYKLVYNDDSYQIKWDFKKFIPCLSVIVVFVLRLAQYQEIPIKKDSMKKIFVKNFIKLQQIHKNDELIKIDEKNNLVKIEIRTLLLEKICGITKYKKGVQTNVIKEDFMKFVYIYNWSYLCDDKIWKFSSTFIHLFVMDLCLKCKLPCFVIGMPGTSKSFAIELLKNKYRDRLEIFTYLSSRTSSPDGIKSQYYDAAYLEMKRKSDTNTEYYSLVFIDEIGNANINPSRPLKFLHSILDNGIELNHTGYTNKIATIGVSNYAMDFANMNRGVLVFTELPTQENIISVFSNDLEKYSLKENKKDFDFIEKRLISNVIQNDKIKLVFQNLWPVCQPKTIALRSIYTMRNLLTREILSFNKDSIYNISRELFNARRLFEQGDCNQYKNLPQCAIDMLKNMKATLDKNVTVDNMYCFLDRIKSSTATKSLSIFTKNFDALEFFDDFDCIFKQETKTESQLKFHKFFAEDFKESPENISHAALMNIIQSISDKDKNQRLLLVGNHPVIDAILDLLNTGTSNSDKNTRLVTLGSGFSSQFRMEDTSFFIVMIANIESLADKENPFSLPFLDRTETIYLDWDIIAPYYLKIRFPECSTDKSIEQIKQNIDKELEKHQKYETIEPQVLHLNIKHLYDCINKLYQNNQPINAFSDDYFNILITQRWEKGIKVIITTKSRIFEDIFIPDDHEVGVLIKDESKIQNLAQLETQMNEFYNQKSNLIVIIRCSTYDEMHFAHIKTFFDTYQNHHVDKILHCFIVFFGIDISTSKPKPTVKWPILSIEDISIHKEFNDSFSVKQIQNFCYEVNHIHHVTPSNEITYIFNQLLNNIIEYYEDKFTQEKVKERFYDYLSIANIKCADLILRSNISFDINLVENNFISYHSQFLENINNTIREEFQAFFYFGFASQYTTENSVTYLIDYLIKIPNLKSMINTHLINFDSCAVLMHDYLDSLITNKFIDSENSKIKVAKEFERRIMTIPNKTIKDKRNIIQKIISGFYEIIETPTFKENGIFNIFFPKKYFSDSFIDFSFFTEYAGFRKIAGLNLFPIIEKIHSLNNDYYSEEHKNVFWNNYLIKSIINISKTCQNIDRNIDKNNDETNYTILSILENQINTITEFYDQVIYTEGNDTNVPNYDKIISIFPSNIMYTYSENINSRNQKRSIKTSRNQCIDLKEICKKNIKLENRDDFHLYNAVSKLNFMNENSQIWNDVGNNTFYEYVIHVAKNSVGDLTKPQAKSFVASFLLLHILKQFNHSTTITNLYKDFNYPDIPEYQDEKVKPNLIFSQIIVDKSDDGYIKEQLGKKVISILQKLSTLKSYKEIDSTKIQNKNYLSENNLIEEIQDFIDGKASKKFNEWLFTYYLDPKGISLLTHSLLQVCINPNDDQAFKQLSKVLNPYNNEEKLTIPFLTKVEESLTNDEDLKSIKHPLDITKGVFQFNSNTQFYFISPTEPILSVILYQMIVCGPINDYPLIAFILKHNQFFTTFSSMQRLMDMILNLRFQFSRKPIVLPILFMNSTLFPNKDSDSLPSIFDFEVNKPFSDIDLTLIEKMLIEKGEFANLKGLSAYEQIKRIWKHFIIEYNSCVTELNKILSPEQERKGHDNNIIQKEENVMNIVLPRMLITSLNIKDFLFPVIYSQGKLSGWKIEAIEENIRKLLLKDSPASYPTIELINDFLGFSNEDYQNLFSVIHNMDLDEIEVDFTENEEKSKMEMQIYIMYYLLHLYLEKDQEFQNECQNENDSENDEYKEIEHKIKEKIDEYNDTIISSINDSLRNSSIENDLYDIIHQDIFENNTLRISESKKPHTAIFAFLPENVRNVFKSNEQLQNWFTK